MNGRAWNILRVDAGAAFIVGIAMLVLRDWLAALYTFPVELVSSIGVCNISYAAYSGSLTALAASDKTPSRLMIVLLVAANLVWLTICLGILVVMHDDASVFGLLHVALEGLFVGALAVLEARVILPQLTRA